MKPIAQMILVLGLILPLALTIIGIPFFFDRLRRSRITPNSRHDVVSV
jgi:hypothetical protein